MFSNTSVEDTGRMRIPPLLLTQLRTDEFSKRFWRRKPYVARGVARELCDASLSHDGLHDLARRQKAIAPHLVHQKEAGSVFVERIDSVSRSLRDLCQQFSALVDSAEVWIDASAMANNGSIGAHFDDSDNIVIQIEGSKTWSLSSADDVTEDQKRARMIGTPQVGDFQVPARAETVVLEPGDVLYLPIFWPHHGVSNGQSASISIVVNSKSALDVVGDRLIPALANLPEWWRPLPVQFLDRADPAPLPDMPLLRSAARAAIEALQGDACASRLEAELVDLASGNTTPPSLHRGSISSPAPPRPSIKMSVPDRAGIEIKRFRPLFEKSTDAFSLAETIFPDPGKHENAQLRRLLQLSALKRFLKAALTLSSLDLDAELKSSLGVLMRSFERLPDEVLLRCVARPHLFSWSIIAMRAAEDGDRTRAGRLVAHLGAFLVPDLIQNATLEPGEQFYIHTSRTSELDFGAIGHSLLLDTPASGLLSVYKTLDGFVVVDAGGVIVAETTGTEMRSEARRTQGCLWMPAPRLVDDEGPIVLRADSWFDAHYPKNLESRASPLAFRLQDDEFESFRATVATGAGLIKTYWPELWSDLKTDISCVAPLSSFGTIPHNESVHGFRGFIALSARPSYLGAQSLAHEAGHNKFSTICDIFKLFENEENFAFSPFVEDDRPLEALGHGIFSFLQDIAITKRLEGAVESLPRHSLDEYYTFTRRKVGLALSLLKETAKLTVRGEEFLHGSELAFNAL